MPASALNTSGSLLLAEIEDFLRETGMTQTAFGRMALGDVAFVTTLRHGRRGRSPRQLHVAMENKVRMQMATYREHGVFLQPQRHPVFAPRAQPVPDPPSPPPQTKRGRGKDGRGARQR